VVDQAKRWTGHAIDAPAAVEGASSDPQAVHGIESILQTDKADASDAAKPDPDAVLSAGIQDVTNTLVEDYDLNDVLLMVLETMYRALGFKHALICVRDNKRGVMQARIGLGDGVDRVVKHFRFNLAFEPDVFHLALKEGADIVIEDVQGGGIASKIPAWYRDLLDAQSFILLPLAINKVTVGLFYADMEMANSLKLSEKQLSLLRTLRNQAVLAIKQKY
jgi:transcriptional regulator with GAF, ATPase, and Fis domain